MARDSGMVVVLWRAGLRISEALALTESDLDATRCAMLVRRGKGGKRREIGMPAIVLTQVAHDDCALASHMRGELHAQEGKAADTSA